jgi:site-specific recombinase XerD
MTKEETIKKLERDMQIRGRNPVTVEEYKTKARLYQDYYDKPADELGEEDIINYLHYLAAEKKISAATVNTYNSAIRFLYGVTLGRALNYKKLPRMKQKRSLPQIYTKAEVKQIIDSAETLIHKAMLMLAYGSGLRLSEIVSLKISDIESKQKRIFIRSGKGDRDRYAMLSDVTLETLREYWKAYRPKDWLFEAPRTGGHYHDRTLQDAFKSALSRSGIKKPGTIHTLRHCFATHLYEDGHNLLALKKLLGHVRIDTTAWYTQLAYSDIIALRSPIDNGLRKKYGNPRKTSENGTRNNG